MLTEEHWCILVWKWIWQNGIDYTKERLPDCPIKEVKMPENEWEVTKVPCYITVSDEESEWTEKGYDFTVYRPSESVYVLPEQDDLSD